MEAERTLLDILVAASALTLASAMPFLYSALGEVFSQLSGIFNLGVEGIMLMGAFSAIYVASDMGLNMGLPAGVLAGMLVGAVFGLIMAFVSVTMHADQGIGGIGITLVGRGLSTTLFVLLADGILLVESFQPVVIPVLGDLPLIGEILFRQNVMVYGALLLVPVTAWLLRHTTWGLQIRAVGQNPAAADSMGVNVERVRYSAVVLGGIMAGLAGASMPLALTNVFQVNMTSGLGFIAVAMVYFGGWSPWRVMLGSLLFSAAYNLQIWVQVLDIKLFGETVPVNFLLMMPYILAILVLIFARDMQRYRPRAMNKPFRRGEG